MICIINRYARRVFTRLSFFSIVCYSKNRCYIIVVKKGEIGKVILKTLLLSGAIFLVLSSPAGTRLFLKQLPKALKRYKKWQLRRALERLRFQNKIEYISEQADTITVKITQNGKNYLKQIDFDSLSLEKPKSWDRKWRLIIFDIPEKKKLAREALRNKLKYLGFVKLQDSVWVTPFPCEKEIDLIKTIFNLSDFWLGVIMAENLGIWEYQLRRRFGLV